MPHSRHLLTGGRLWVGDGFETGSLLLRNGRIEQILAPDAPLPDPAPESVVDLAGAAVLPGFVDAHAHPLIAGRELRGAPVREARSREDAVRIARDYASANPHLPWIVGEGFDLSIDPRGVYFAEDLDRAVPDRPVALRSSDIHTMWANTAALEAAGITRTTPDPTDGVIERDRDGHPSGTLREWGAFMPLLRAIPREPEAETAEALLRGLAALSAEGVTTVQDAWVELEDLDAYLRAARRGLPVRLNLAFRAVPGGWRQQVHDFALAAERVAALELPDFTARTVKFFADGIVEGGTAHVSEPYHGSSCCGVPAWDPEELAAAAEAFDAAGFQLHIHAIGDAGMTSAIDAVQRASERNGARDRRPVIAHAQLVAREDLARLVALDITVAVQPYWAKLDGVVRHLTNGRLRGPREHRQYPFRTMRDAGVRLASSSDYPITTPSPLKAIGVAISRDELGELSRSWIPEERLDLVSAVEAATSAAAYTQFADDGLGRLAVGAPADFVVVPGLSELPLPAELLGARVTATWRNGAPISPTTDTANRPLNESLEGESS